MPIQAKALALASVSLADHGDFPPSTQPSLASSTTFSDESSDPTQFSHADPAVNALIQRFASTVFRDALPQKLPPVRNIFHQINLLPNHTPPFRPPYRLSPLEQTELSKQLKEY